MDVNWKIMWKREKYWQCNVRINILPELEYLYTNSVPREVKIIIKEGKVLDIIIISSVYKEYWKIQINTKNVYAWQIVKICEKIIDGIHYVDRNKYIYSEDLLSKYCYQVFGKKKSVVRLQRNDKKVLKYQKNYFFPIINRIYVKKLK